MTNKSIDGLAASFLIIFSILLGLNQVLVKLVNVGMHPVFQVALRSTLAIFPILIYCYLTKKKIIPYIDLEYSTELALGNYWSQLDNKQKKIFERDIKNSLIQDYVPYLVDYPDWENINIVVDKNFSQIESLANVKLLVSIENDSYPLIIALKLKKSNRWKIYDLDIQSVSLIDIFKIGYDSKIKRQGIEKLVNKMLSKS